MRGVRDALALAAAAATGIQVGAAMVATRFVIADIGPASLAFLRYAIAVLCLLPFCLRIGRVRFAPRDLVGIMGLGIVQFGILIALLNIGLRLMPSTRAALLFATFPLLTMVIAARLGHERLSAAKTAGVMLTIAGVGATLGESLFAEAGRSEWLGVLAVLAATLCGALCSVLYRPYLARYPTLPLGALAMVASVMFLDASRPGRASSRRRRGSRPPAGARSCSSAPPAASATCSGSGPSSTPRRPG